MAEIKDIIAYIIANYPHKSELSNARLTKLVYLTDWKMAITHHIQASNINWYFDNYGPFVWDVHETAKNNPSIFKIEGTFNMFGRWKRLIKLKNEGYKPKLTEQEQNAIEHVIKTTSKLNWDDFIRLVYSTYPILSSERYSNLDLLDKAESYQEYS